MRAANEALERAISSLEIRREVRYMAQPFEDMSGMLAIMNYETNRLN